MFGPFGEAALLGIVHGVAEFLPLSSAGHRALMRLLYNLVGNPALELLLEVATLSATLVVIWPEVARTFKAGARSLLAPARFATSAGGRDALAVIVASIPSLALGAFLHVPAARFRTSPLALGLGFLGTTAALVLAQASVPGDRERTTVRGSLLLGMAQGLSVLPGVSRTGSTLAVALLLGLRPERAFELSMLISLPLVAGTIGLDARKALSVPFPGSSAVVGAVVALLAGILALELLRVVVRRRRLGWFAFWVGPLALATLALGLAWPP